MLNSLPVMAEARQPRGMVLANGERLAGVVSFQVDNNSFYQADTFRVVLALSAQAADRDMSWWANQQKIEIELLAGFPPDPDGFTRSDLSSLLIGYVDDIEIDMVAGEILLSGRDLTSKLIDTKRSVSFVGGPSALKASDVVRKIAAEVGLNPVVTETTSAAGGYYQIVKAIVEANTTYWDIVSRLAQISKFAAYVSGRDLHFEPREPLAQDPYIIEWQAPDDDRAFPVLNAARLKFARNLSIARDIKVRVVSYDQKQKREVTATAEKKRVRNVVTGKSAAQTEPPTEYTYSFPNLKQYEAQQRANELIEELSRHEMNLHVEMPADSILTPRTAIKVRGTSSAVDQLYYPTSIVRSFSMGEGYRMDVSAKNQSPDVEIPQ